jgi:hypothetical protein
MKMSTMHHLGGVLPDETGQTGPGHVICGSRKISTLERLYPFVLSVYHPNVMCGTVSSHMAFAYTESFKNEPDSAAKPNAERSGR